MRALTVLFLTPLVACGGSDRYLVRSDPAADPGPIVAAIRPDGLTVGLRKNTFEPTGEPAPSGTRVVRGRGAKHPMAIAGYVLGNPDWGPLSVDVETPSIHRIAELTLALLLFSDAARVNFSRLKRDARLPGRLARAAVSPRGRPAGTARFQRS